MEGEGGGNPPLAGGGASIDRAVGGGNPPSARGGVRTGMAAGGGIPPSAGFTACRDIATGGGDTHMHAEVQRGEEKQHIHGEGER